MIMIMSMSSIDIEVIRTVLFFILKYFAQKKNTQALFKYLNTPKKTINNASNFHLDIRQ